MESVENKNTNIILDDMVLVRKCVAGDNVAMGLLITKYQDRVYNVILKICQNPNDALELTQDTFVKVIEKIGSFKANSKLFTWIYRIAVNLTLNYCSRKVKFAADSLDGKGAENSETQAGLKAFLTDESVADPSEVVQQQELVEVAQQALDSLSQEHRVVIVLRDIENLSYAEIAEVLNSELGTVKSRISRARDALRKVFKSMVD